MESRKMILMKLFAGQQWRQRHREQTMDMGSIGREEADRGTSGESSMETYTPLNIK